MKKLFILFISLSVIFIFTQCRTTRTGVDGTTSSTSQQKNEKQLTDSPIQYCTYLQSSMMGRKKWSVTRQEDGEYIIKFSQAIYSNNDMPMNLEFKTDNKIDADLHELFREANIQNRTTPPSEDEPIVHDSPNMSFEVMFMDHISYSNKIPYENSPEIKDAMEKADKYILNFVKEHRK